MAVAIIVLAAGSGTRMKSNSPKVLQKVAGAPLLWHVIKSTLEIKPSRTILVIRPQSEAIIDTISDFGICPECVIQEQPLGTGHAVLAAKNALKNYDGRVIILYGDTPFIRPETLKKLANSPFEADLTVLGFIASNPNTYGRLMIDDNGYVSRIIEFKDANPEELKISICNSGVIAVNSKTLFRLLEKVSPNKKTGEYYLTDIVEIAQSSGLKTQMLECDETETLGVNSNADLAVAEATFQQRARIQTLNNGVNLLDPETIYFSIDTELEPDCSIEPFVIFGLGVKVESGVRIRSFSYLEDCLIQKNAEIGPFARIRPNTIVGSDAKIGNFVEIKKSKIGNSTKVSHLSYIGDTEVGDKANIGAGTITCNFDGKNKHSSTIGHGAFIGSDSIIVSPVKIGDGSMTAAGSVIDSDVPAKSLGISRTRMSVVKGFANRFDNSNSDNKNDD